MANSTVETLLADLVTEAQTIQTPTYRNNPTVGTMFYGNPDDVPSLPFISVTFNNGTIVGIGSARSTFSEYVDVGVFGYFENGLQASDDTNTKNTSGESLLHDVKTMLAGFVMKYITTVSKGQYHICSLGKDRNGDILFAITRWQPNTEGKGMFLVEFKVQILVQTATFGVVS